MYTARQKLIARNVAVCLLGGVWSPEAMAGRLMTFLGKRTRKSQRKLIAEVVQLVGTDVRPPVADLARTIVALPSFARAAVALIHSERPLRMALRPPSFAPNSALAGLDIPSLPTSGDVARWLELPIEQLDWFADARRQHGRTTKPSLQHYRYAFRAKIHGPPRLIEAPKARLKAMQRRILHGILDHVPSHEAAHGFVRGRSCRSGAELHIGADRVVCLDIADFFLTTPLGRVGALFRALGYPHQAARVLTGLCSTVTPEIVLDDLPSPARHTRAALAAYLEPHLPQGAPTSPALANLVAWRLDVRLSGLARSFGGRYTRYADDLTFSGDAAFAQKTRSLIEAVREIVETEGWRLNERKMRIMTRSTRQQVTGIVTNAHPNVPRESYDRLKAILHNCRHNGLEAENRDGHADFRAHLEGRVGWVESVNPARGMRLRAMLGEIR